MSLTAEQVDALLAPLDRGRVKQHRGNSHLEAWDDRRHLLRIFGWGGFDIETIELACIAERSVWSEDPKKPFDGRHLVIYRAQARLIIKDPAGVEVCHFDDGATGDAVNQPVLGDAHDLAMKAAMSQALKRCCVNLGDRFGLSLYNKGGTGAVVGKSLAHPATTEREADDDVTGGELDEARHVTDDQGEPTRPTRPDGICSCGHFDKVHPEQGCNGLRLTGPGNEYDGGDFAPCRCENFDGVRVNEYEPPLADNDQHQILRAALDALDPDDLAAVKAWWQQQHLPSIKDADTLTVDQVEAAFAHLEALHDAKQSMTEKRKDRARQIAEDAGLPVPEELQGPAKARAALSGGGE